MSTHCITEERTALYRFYDGQGMLLYAGITNDPWRRWREHVLEKPWYPRVRHQSVTWYDSEPQARKAETRAIHTEGPEFNIAGAVKPVAPRFAVSLNAFLAVMLTWLMLPVALFLVIICFRIRTLGLLDGVVTASMPIPLLAVFAVIGHPLIYRLGCWFKRNLSDDVYRGGKS